MAAAVADYRPVESLDAKRPKDGAPGRSSSSRRPTCSRRSAPTRGPARCSSGSPPRRASAASSARARSSRERTLDLIVSTTCRARHRLRRGGQRGDARLGATASATVAKAAKDEIAARDPRRDRGGSLAERGVEAPGRAARRCGGGPRSSSNARAVVHADRRRRFGSSSSALVAEGHVIIEDCPGRRQDDAREGARARRSTARSRGSSSRPTCCPSDVTGVSVFDQRTNDVRRSGPGRCSRTSLLVDEINRASPKTQAALLECMQESQVTVDGVDAPARSGRSW